MILSLYVIDDFIHWTSFQPFTLAWWQISAVCQSTNSNPCLRENIIFIDKVNYIEMRVNNKLQVNYGEISTVLLDPSDLVVVADCSLL